MEKRNATQNKKNNNEFKAKKHFGQNFLSDNSVCHRIASMSEIDGDTTIIEIGPGMGALTKELVKNAKKVLAFEIDTEVIPILKENLKEYDNLEVKNVDILKADLNDILSIEGKVISVSNLPYYITSPIIDLFLKKLKNVSKGVFMVQKEVAERICAEKGTKDYNSFSILVQYFAKCRKIINVPRTCFRPQPNVDSAVIELKKFEREHKPINEETFIKTVEGAFRERRKTLVNNLSFAFKIQKDDVKDCLMELGIDENVRGEALSIDDFIELSDLIENRYNG